MITLDDYLQHFPEQRQLSEQDMMPKRIEFEKIERERMEEARLELVEVKQKLLKDNAQKKEELRKLDEKLEAMVDSFKPIEEALVKDI